jgi:hypothetical protein
MAFPYFSIVFCGVSQPIVAFPLGPGGVIVGGGVFPRSAIGAIDSVAPATAWIDEVFIVITYSYS